MTKVLKISIIIHIKSNKVNLYISLINNNNKTNIMSLAIEITLKFKQCISFVILKFMSFIVLIILCSSRWIMSHILHLLNSDLEANRENS